MDAAFGEGLAAIAAVQAGASEPLFSLLIPAKDNNEAELIGYYLAALRAPEGAVLCTDSGRVHALLRGRTLPGQAELPYLEGIHLATEQKGLTHVFIGGKRRRRRRAHRFLHTQADRLAYETLQNALNALHEP